MSIEIREAVTPKEIKEYIKFAWKIYRNDEFLNEHWVPHLIDDYMKTLDTKKYPLWRHSERKCFTAWRNDEMVGTITAVKNGRHLEFHKDGVGFWGFFECINDNEVSRALFDAAKSWLISKGLKVMRGPVSPSINDQIGMLSKGYDSSPVFLMTYNPAYYHELCKDYQFEIAQELIAWYIDKENVMPSFERIQRISQAILKRENLTIRNFNFNDFDKDVDIALTIYNKAWQDNWGSVPMTREEFYETAKGLKQVADPDFVYIAENDKGEPIGLSLTLPDMNIALKHCDGNPLTPMGLIKFLWNKRKVNGMRTIMMGVIDGYRNKGIDSIFNTMTISKGLKKGYVSSELSWVLKSNESMNRLAKAIHAVPYKEYIVYERNM